MLLTRGELGGLPEVRTREFLGAMNGWGFDHEIWNWPDLLMSMDNLEVQVRRVTQKIREEKPTVVVSFGKWTDQMIFRHPDHDRTGDITDRATFAASIANFMPEITAVPTLRLFWWQDGGGGSREYFLKYYPSQFNAGNVDIVDKLGEEKYLQIR